MTILITGASGQIGTHLAADLAAAGITLRLLDLTSPQQCRPAAAEFIQADLRDLDAVEKAAAGTEAIIHLAGITHETAFADIVDHNIIATHHVLEAARRQHVPRVVLASSHHVTGLNPAPTPDTGHPLELPTAPDSFYAVSKVTMEALGRLYAHKTRLTVVAVRIGSFRNQPTEPRHRATWLSPHDATHLLHAAATHPLPCPFLLTYGTSANWCPHTTPTTTRTRTTHRPMDRRRLRRLRAPRVGVEVVRHAILGLAEPRCSHGAHKRRSVNGSPSGGATRVPLRCGSRRKVCTP